MPWLSSPEPLGASDGASPGSSQQGARVYITGRSVPDHRPFDEPVTAIRCEVGARR